VIFLLNVIFISTFLDAPKTSESNGNCTQSCLTIFEVIFALWGKGNFFFSIILYKLLYIKVTLKNTSFSYIKAFFKVIDIQQRSPSILLSSYSRFHTSFSVWVMESCTSRWPWTQSKSGRHQIVDHEWKRIILINDFSPFIAPSKFI